METCENEWLKFANFQRNVQIIRNKNDTLTENCTVCTLMVVCGMLAIIKWKSVVNEYC